MKQLKCLKCSKIRYVDDAELNSVNTCPFCSSQIRCKGTFGNIDTLGKEIYQAISTGGFDLLTSSERISGYLMDLLPDQRKEIRIFTKTFNDDAGHQNTSPIIIKRSMAKTEISGSANGSISYRVGRGMKFGHHENGDSMHWRILAIDDNLALLHYTGSDLKQQFHDKDIDISWKDCKLREWLNRDFIRNILPAMKKK